MFSIDSHFIKTDVTSVKILKEHYLVGVGGYVHVFGKDSCKLLTKINIFKGQKIYEIIPDRDENRILLYGGTCIKIITIDKDFMHASQSDSITSPDWILAAKWIDDDQRIATVSMHNKLQIWSTTLKLISERECEEKCILYSAFICHDNFENLVILSGTVFSEVLVWRPETNKDNRVLKRLQWHKGVIFSVHYDESSGYICSSSDDRSAVLWRPKTNNLRTELEKENIDINVACHVFGHLSRIFRCHVLKDCFITAGEDSFLNIWSFDGELIRKIETHQGGPIWAIDANKNDGVILTGGSDCGVTLFPINCNFEEQKLSMPSAEIPKIVGTLADNNLVVFSESGALYYYNRTRKKWLYIQKHIDLASYVLMVPSKCKNLVALAGLQGQIYIYRQENNTLCAIVSSETKIKSRIYAFHWINCTTFLICHTEGLITLYYLKNSNIAPISHFLLPPSKERWSTTAIFSGKNFVIGDRRGNLHLFEIGKSDPIQTLKRVHSLLGVTNLIENNGRIISLGRNSIIKTFLVKNNSLQLMSSNKLPFTWLVDFIGDLLLTFSGDKFVLWNHVTKRVIFDKSCGGGHRSWDFLRDVNYVLFCYIKDKAIHTIDLNLRDFTSVDLLDSYHAKEINAVKVIKVSNNYIVISGGEDTTLRVNVTNGTNFYSIISLKPHLSSIRTITSYKLNKKSKEKKETHLAFSGGGRAQIICWKLEIFTENNCLKDIIWSEQHSYYKIIDNEKSEMRIMDLTVAETENQLLLLAACSDGNVKIFSIKENSGKYQLCFYRDIFYKLKCILKLCIIDNFSSNILVTMATDGILVFWDMNDFFNNENEIKFIHSIEAHQSGINSYSFKIIANDLCLFLTGGDDNAIVLNLIRFKNVRFITVESIHVFRDTGTHCAQVTGAFLSNDYFLTASIDQRVAIFKWELIDEKIVCKYITKYNTAVADVQGLCCFENDNFDAFIYGKGIEYIKIKKK